MDSPTLKDSGLEGSGLRHISIPILVDRYNDCLNAIGIAPTRLPAFDIDGKGWSPQIAEEKKDHYYLAHKYKAPTGELQTGATQFAIILTPDQHEQPVYKPYYSFERDLMDFVFANAARAIADLTSRAGIWMQIEPGITAFDAPEDIVVVRSVTITLNDTNGIMASAIEQEGLVNRFNAKPLAWTNEALRKQIRLSGQTHGDFRCRDAIIPSMTVSDLDYFYVEVFGGTFLLKATGVRHPLVVVAGDYPGATKRARNGVWSTGDPKLLDRLFADQLVEVSTSWYREHPGQLEDLKEHMLVEALEQNGRCDIEMTQLTSAQKRRCAMDCKEMLPKEFGELERFGKILTDGDDPAVRSRGLRTILMRPHSALPPSAQKVVWRLLSRMTGISLYDLYLYDKPMFFNRFGQWPVWRQTWAIKHLTNRGIRPQGDQS